MYQVWKFGSNSGQNDFLQKKTSCVSFENNNPNRLGNKTNKVQQEKVDEKMTNYHSSKRCQEKKYWNISKQSVRHITSPFFTAFGENVLHTQNVGNWQLEEKGRFVYKVEYKKIMEWEESQKKPSIKRFFYFPNWTENKIKRQFWLLTSHIFLLLLDNMRKSYYLFGI